MPESLPEFLRQRALRSLRYLQKETEEVAAADALRFASPDWPAHRFGIGQNGSIAGIVSHVAAWKQLTLPIFTLEETLLPIDAANLPMEALPDAPAPDDWQGIRDWLQRSGAAWQAELDALPDAAYDASRQWGTHTVTLTEYIAEMIEHDIQHAAQIEYLRQRLRVEK